jgi:hypothetical protein
MTSLEITNTNLLIWQTGSINSNTSITFNITPLVGGKMEVPKRTVNLSNVTITVPINAVTPGAAEFAGLFQGSLTITNVTVNNSAVIAKGEGILFGGGADGNPPSGGGSNGGTTNVVVTDITIATTNISDYSGGVIGVFGKGTFTNIEVILTGGATSGQESGGICGAYYQGKGSGIDFINCKFTGKIGQRAGGICGSNCGDSDVTGGSVTISGCYSNGIIGIDGGGIIGAFDEGVGVPSQIIVPDVGTTININKSYSLGSSIASGAGGIVGTKFSEGTLNITECYSQGQIAANAGGITGQIGQVGKATNVNITDCYSSGTNNGKGIVSSEEGTISGTVTGCVINGGLFNTTSLGTNSNSFNLLGGVPYSEWTAVNWVTLLNVLPYANANAPNDSNISVVDGIITIAPNATPSETKLLAEQLPNGADLKVTVDGVVIDTKLVKDNGTGSPVPVDLNNSNYYIGTSTSLIVTPQGTATGTLPTFTFTSGDNKIKFFLNNELIYDALAPAKGVAIVVQLPEPNEDLRIKITGGSIIITNPNPNEIVNVKLIDPNTPIIEEEEVKKINFLPFLLYCFLYYISSPADNQCNDDHYNDHSSYGSNDTY